jgi:hypothetical protein
VSKKASITSIYFYLLRIAMSIFTTANLIHNNNCPMFIFSLISKGFSHLAGNTQGLRRQLTSVRLVFLAPVE